MKELNLKPTLISDFVVGVEAIKTARKLRKRGANKVAITTAKSIPIVDFGYWGWTPEWCLKYPGTRDTVRAVFHSFSEDVQHKLTFSPTDGEFVERARLWREALRPVLSPKQYSDTILVILDWLVQVKRFHLGLRGKLCDFEG